MSKKTIFLAVLIMAVLLGSTSPQTPARAAAPARIYLIHGINGQDLGQPLMQYPVDVSISGLGCVKANLMFRGYIGPIIVGPGWYSVSVSPAAVSPAVPCSNPAVIWGAWYAAEGASYVVLTHLTTTATPTISEYPYDLSHTTSDNGKARFTIANGSQNPSIDFYMRGKKGTVSRVIKGILNGQGVTFQNMAGSYKMQFNPNNLAIPMFGPIVVKPVKFYHYFIALVGSPFHGYFTASFSVKTYPLDLNPYVPFPWP